MANQPARSTHGDWCKPLSPYKCILLADGGDGAAGKFDGGLSCFACAGRSVVALA